MATPEDLLAAVDEVISDGVRRGLLHNDVEDDRLDGRLVTVHGRRLVNFGSCSYLGLETDPRMKAAVRDAVDRFGTQFSSSRAYASAPLYRVAEQELAELFGRPVIVAPSTSIGHIAAMPTLIDQPGRAAARPPGAPLGADGGDARAGRRGPGRADPAQRPARRWNSASETHRDRRVWYAADGLYSHVRGLLPRPRARRARRPARQPVALRGRRPRGVLDREARARVRPGAPVAGDPRPHRGRRAR